MAHNTRSGAEGGRQPASPPSLAQHSQLGNPAGILAESEPTVQQTGSGNSSKQTAAKSTKDHTFLLLRSGYDSDKTAVDNAIDQVVKMGSRVQTQHDANPGSSRLRGFVKQLVETMKKAKMAMDIYEKSSHDLIAMASYLVLVLKDDNTKEAGEANDIQVEIKAESKPYTTKLDDFYYDNIHLFDIIQEDETASSQSSSRQTSRNVSLERRPRFQDFSHLKPQTLSSDCSVREYEKWRSMMEEWFEHGFSRDGDKKLMWVSLKACIDSTWLEILERKADIATSEMTEVFKCMEAYLLQMHPLITRRLETLRIMKPKEEPTSELLNRLMVSYHSSQLATPPVQTRCLLHCIGLLNTTPVDEKIKTYLIEKMRIDPDIDDLGPIFSYITNLEGDEIARQSTAKANQRVNNVKDPLDKPLLPPPTQYQCRVCDKRHAKKKCQYTCEHCKVRGSHKKDRCWQRYPHLKDGGYKRDRSRERSSSRREGSREATPHPTSRDRGRGRQRRVSGGTDRDSSVE